MKYTAGKWLVVLCLSILLAACDAATDIEPSGKTFKIAFVGYERADRSGRDQDVLEGILAANAADPMLDNGDRLEIVHVSQVETEKPVSKTITETINEHIEGDQISAVLLGASSKTVLQEKRDIDAIGIPTLAIIATHPDVTDDAVYISQLSFDDERQGQAAALFVRDELVIKRAAVLFDETDPYSGYLGQVFRTTFEQAGGQIDEFSIFSRLDQNMLTRLKARDTQIIYMPLGAQQIFHVLEQLEILDWNPDVMAADGLLATVLQEHPERLDELTGLYVTDLYSHTNEFVSLAKFAKRITGFHDQMFSDESSTDTALGVEAYQVVKFAMNQCPDHNNGNCINREIRSIENHQGIISKFSILANGKSSRPVYINTIQDGRLNLVVKVN